MSFFNKLKESLVSLREEDEGYEYEVVEEEVAEPESKKRTTTYDVKHESDNVKRIQPDIPCKIVLAELNSIDDAPDVVNNLRVNQVCIVNLEGVELDTAQRIADFLGGASYAMNGNIERINESIFVMAPLGVNIEDLMRHEEKSVSSIFSWVSKSARF